MSSPLSPTRIAAFALPLRLRTAATATTLAKQQERRASASRRQRLAFGSGGDDGLTLEHFLIRTRFLTLYRSIVRATRDIPNPEARRETLAWYRSDLFPPSLKLERDLINLKEALAQGYRQLKQIQGQFTLLGAGGIRTPGASSGPMTDDGAGSPHNTLTDPARYTALLDTLLESAVAERLVLDLRPEQDFAAGHLQNATHLPGGWPELNSRFSTYLPARGSPFLVVCQDTDEADLRRNLGEREGLIGIVVCRAGGHASQRAPQTEEDALTDPLGASEASFWQAAERAGVLRSSTASAGGSGGRGKGSPSSPFSSTGGSRRSAHTLAPVCPPTHSANIMFSRSTDDTPHLMGQPSPALARTYNRHIRPALAHRTEARALDLGCGAGRDLAWLAYRGHMERAHSPPAESSPAWRVVGLDNVRPVLIRAQHLMDAYGLMLQAALTDDGRAGCEDLLWAQVSPRGSLLALRTAGTEDTGSRNGKPFLVQDGEDVSGVLLPQGSSAYALALPHGHSTAPVTPFDLVILVRFLPRTFLWDRPETIHALVRRGSNEDENAKRDGGFVLISHFVVPEEVKAVSLSPAQCGSRPALRRTFDAPPEAARLQAGEIRKLIESWNAWWAAQDPATWMGEPEWSIVEDVVEPIEDGRAVQSVLIQRR